MGKKTKIAFIATTTVFVVAALPGAVMNLVHPEIAVEMSKTLGIPLALLTLVGAWKLLGVAALVLPGAPRLKEFAYAGFFFDLTGAAYLHAAANDFGGVLPPLVLASVLVASYVLRLKVTAATSSADEASAEPKPAFAMAKSFS